MRASEGEKVDHWAHTTNNVTQTADMLTNTSLISGPVDLTCGDSRTRISRLTIADRRTEDLLTVVSSYSSQPGGPSLEGPVDIEHHCANQCVVCSNIFYQQTLQHSVPCLL